jgi:uncharacterized protein YbjT (DUF2867 family)
LNTNVKKVDPLPKNLSFAVSLYVEHGRETFHSVHVEAAQRVAVQARRAGVERFVHVSGIGADAASPSLYIGKRGEGELVVQAAFPDAILIRPAVMFGPDDAFLTSILELLRRLPIYPMFGRGCTRLQPAYVEDVAEAIAQALQRTQTQAITFECGGPCVYSYEELLHALAREAGLKRILIPLPFVAWWALAWSAELLPDPPITRNQVELMQVDNVCSPWVPGFAELGISPRSVENMLQQTLQSRKAACRRDGVSGGAGRTRLTPGAGPMRRGSASDGQRHLRRLEQRLGLHSVKVLPVNQSMGGR